MKKIFKLSFVFILLLVVLMTCTGCKKDKQINEINSNNVKENDIVIKNTIDEIVAENTIENVLENTISDDMENTVENMVEDTVENTGDKVISNMVKREISNYDETKTGKYYNRFSDGDLTVKYEMKVNDQLLTMISSTGENKSYIETILDGERISTVLTIDDVFYTIDHSSKTIIEMTGGYQASGGIASYVVTDRDVDLKSFAEGKITIEDVEYDAEEWVIENEKVKMCFENDELKYIVSGENESEYVIKILEISNEVNKDLFEFPADYTKMKF